VADHQRLRRRVTDPRRCTSCPKRNARSPARHRDALRDLIPTALIILGNPCRRQPLRPAILIPDLRRVPRHRRRRVAVPSGSPPDARRILLGDVNNASTRR
jgi:hypothetical protein